MSIKHGIIRSGDILTRGDDNRIDRCLAWCADESDTGCGYQCLGGDISRIVYDPYVEAYHDESRTRGPEDSPEKVRRFQEEIEYMRVHWLPILKNGDPNYNRNLSLKKWNYSLKA
jgi:hypothetical protein